MDGLKGYCQLPCGEAAGGGLPRLPWRSWLCVCQDMPGHLQEGASLFSSQSPEGSHSGDNEKWHFHKVERKRIVSLAHYAPRCSGDNSS